MKLVVRIFAHDELSFCVRYMVAYAINKYSNSCSCVVSIILRFVLFLVIGIVV